MKPTALIASAAILVALVGISRVRAVAAQDAQSECLHGPDETEAQRARRVSAFQHIRAINWAQHNEKLAPNRQWRAEIPGLMAPPDGFTSQFLVSKEGYLASVKDAKDPCHWALFSDETGLIYVGQPVQ